MTTTRSDARQHPQVFPRGRALRIDSQGAQRLFVASSAVNRQILKLEEELGAELFDRLPTGMRLNAAGDVVLRRVRTTLHDFERISSNASPLLSAAWPRCASMHFRTISSCRASAFRIASWCVSHNRVLPSMSVNVTVPVGKRGAARRFAVIEPSRNAIGSAFCGSPSPSAINGDIAE